MAQNNLNSTNNINIPNCISLWFNKDFAVDTQTAGTTPTNAWVEFGDCLIDGVSITPDYAEHRSYRNGRNSLRKRLLTVQNCSINATLNEPNIQNLQRVLYGGTIQDSQSVRVFEARQMELKEPSTGVFQFDFTPEEGGAHDIAASEFLITGIFNITDVTESENLLDDAKVADTDGLVTLSATDKTNVTTAGGVGSTAHVAGDMLYVKFETTVTGMTSTEIYGSTTNTIEGAARLEARNNKGGTVQIWDIASASLSPNGDLGYPLDAIQTVPLTMTLQEREGTWGTLFTK